STARQSLRDRLATLSGWRAQEQTILSQTLPTLIKPNTSIDLKATAEAQRQAEAGIQPTLVSLKRNQVIAREGDTVTDQMLGQFAAIRDYTKTGRRLGHYIGLFFIVGVLYWLVGRYSGQRNTSASRLLSKTRAFSLVCSAVIMQTIFLRVGFTVAGSIASGSSQPPFNDPSTLSLVTPCAAAPLLVTMLAGPPFGMLTGLITAVFAGLLAPNGVLMTMHVMVSSAASIYGIKKYRERQSITLAGLFVAGVSALSGVAVLLIAQQPFTLNAALLALGCGALGGLLAAIFAAGGLPINESFFGILTDVKLLELSNADLPVLSQLALRAPGTNQHSHAVGQLSEEACRAIGANALLARIGALYHDIGKLAAPHMFVENQTTDNPHDRMRPSNSARIIISHVIYGAKMAKELRLPEQIADFIPQHHGTRTLHCFLRKAQEQARQDEAIDETEFRYPGPKPQTREAAVMMLSDSCEAAARSLAHPDPQSIETIVKIIFDAVLSDQQLDECNLTLHELNVIRESIIHSLTAIYHARVDYPGFNAPLPNGSAATEQNGSFGAELSLGARFNSPEDVPISKGGEVEDEAVSRKAAGN
ncbi:MAG: HD family phosphohydrolase, partial [Pyrinomonadaceae bacterium]